MFFFRRIKTSAADWPPPCPATNLWVIGDVHGRFDLLQRLWVQIENSRHYAHNDTIICVGDYIDRGDKCAQVLQFLFKQAQNPNVICLRGNHEDMLLDFLHQPDVTGHRWLRYGGLQTLASYSIGGISDAANAQTLIKARDQLLRVFPKPMFTWLNALPRMYQSGTVCVTHAGMDPLKTLIQQNPSDLTWGHRDFLCKDRLDNRWIVYGHYITGTPGSDGRGRIAVDTGAYHSGVLTAVRITPQGSVSLIQT